MRSWKTRHNAGRHPAYATRRGRRHRALEFPGAAGGMENRTRIAHRQHDSGEAIAIHAIVHSQIREICREILPPGVLNVITGGDELGKGMTAHPDISKIAFTGHTTPGATSCARPQPLSSASPSSSAATIRRSCCRMSTSRRWRRSSSGRRSRTTRSSAIRPSGSIFTNRSMSGCAMPSWPTRAP